ncbi:MAG: alpha/beta hydrolase [Burkholderiales bacterium]|nr:alpha/beta hydrolase [Burkholderiales bacterium]
MRTTINGASLNYEILGSSGPWVAISPGGRRALAAVKPLAQRIAAAGYRVLIHDRRNCGASDVMLSGDAAEHEVWADDQHVLLQRVGALSGTSTVFVGGSSSGCRMSLAYALRYPQAVRGLLLWRVTGGAFAAKRLAKQYYGEYIAAAQAGGMAAVCATAHFRDLIAAHPPNRERLLNADPKAVIAAMTRWSEGFLREADLPVIGASAEQLRTIKAPACVIPGNDNTHPKAVGETLARLLPDATLNSLFAEHQDVDVVPPEDWAVKETEMAAMLLAFMKKQTS